MAAFLWVTAIIRYDLPFDSFHPKPCVVNDSALFQDEFDSLIHYKFLLKTTVHYSEYISRGEKYELEDSIHVFNQRLLEARFRGRYPKFWDDEGIAKERLFPKEDFVWGDSVDSVYYELTIKRTFGIQTWKGNP